MQKVGKICRYLAISAIFLIGINLMLSSVFNFFKLTSSSTEIIGSISYLTSFMFGVIFLINAFKLIKKDRHIILGTALIFIVLAFGSLVFSMILSNIPGDQRINPLVSFILYLIPAILLLISWRYEVPTQYDKAHKAKEIFGDHLKHLKDNEVEDLLK